VRKRRKMLLFPQNKPLHKLSVSYNELRNREARMKALKQNISVFLIMLIVLFFLGVNFFLFSQEKTGILTGRVTDEENTPLPGVTIVAWLPPDEAISTMTTKSNAAGQFRFSNLPEGAYTVTFSLAGFKTATKEIIVKSGQPVHLNATMEITSLEEEITTTAVSPVITPEDSVDDLETTVEKLQIEVTRLANKVNALMESINNYQKKIDDLDKRLKAVEEKIR
jgi:hypothetical protein